MREIKMSTQFKKSYKRVVKYPSFNKNTFEYVVDNLSKDIPLEEKFHDHQLKGKLSAYRECHVAPDLVLIYQKGDELILYLVDISNHSNAF